MTNTAPNSLKIAIAQLNPVMGDLAANVLMARDARMEAKLLGADIVVFSELFISGYPPEDLIDKDAFLHACREACEELAKETEGAGPSILMGTPWLTDDGKRYNAVVLMEGGKVTTMRAKVDLPNYSVFDEKRVFDAGPMPGPIDFRGVRLGVPVCEDAWSEDVPECLAETGAELLIVPNGSPWWEDKNEERQQVMVQRVVETDLPLLYINQLGGQDELVFDGGSFALAKDRTLALQMPQFESGIQMVEAVRQEGGKADGWTFARGPLAKLPDDLEADWRACVMGLGDYVNKNGFPGVVLGLSGGIDSAICAAMAVDALGPGRVHCVMMPYEYTAQHSLEDAEACAKALGVRYDVVEIHAPVEGFLGALGPMFEGTKEGVTEENLQSRTRGTILMALSNKFGSMVVTTGNKSEMSVGYATLYGDMNGGFNPIKDVYKTDVYRMAAWRNAHHPADLRGPAGEVIPERIITKAPSAELRPDQTDQDSLPEYDVLDGILRGLVEDEKSISDIVADGYDVETVGRIEHLLYIAEYKRRQAAPGVKLTSRAFGRDRRYPITNRFRDRRDPAHPSGTSD